MTDTMAPPATDLEDLVAERDEIAAEISAAGRRRDELQAEWRTERAKRRTVLARFPGQEPDPAGAEYAAADAAWTQRLADESQAIAEANGRRRAVERRIEEARTARRLARHRAADQEGSGDAEALAGEVREARGVHADLVVELETLDARHTTAMAEGDAAVLLEVTPRRREVSIEAAAARTAALRAEVAHARAMAAQHAARLHQAGEAVQSAEEALDRAKQDHEAALAVVRGETAERAVWRRRAENAERALAQHLAAQRGPAA